MSTDGGGQRESVYIKEWGYYMYMRWRKDKIWWNDTLQVRQNKGKIWLDTSNHFFLTI